MEMTSDNTYCKNLNMELQESVMIEELPVIAGSYSDLIIVSMSYILIDTDDYNVYFSNFLAILKNM